MSREIHPILAAAKAHFETIEGGSITIAEWDNAEIHWTPLTVAERKKIYGSMKGGAQPDGYTVCTRAMILKACDADGARIFSTMDENQIDHGIDPEVVGRIGAAILGAEGDDDDDKPDAIELAKNA